MAEARARANELRFVVFQEEGMWVATCLEHYIGAQGRTKDEAYLGLKIAYRAELDHSVRKNGVPFDGIMPAPKRFHELWKAGPPLAEGGRIYDQYNEVMELEPALALAA